MSRLWLRGSWPKELLLKAELWKGLLLWRRLVRGLVSGRWEKVRQAKDQGMGRWTWGRLVWRRLLEEPLMRRRMGRKRLLGKPLLVSGRRATGLAGQALSPQPGWP